MNSARLGEPGQGVVEGLVAQLLLELLQLLDRLLEPVVLQRDAGVVCERLEQLQVVSREGMHHAGAVGEHDRPDHALLAGEHRDHRVVYAALVADTARPRSPSNGARPA